MSKAIAKRTRAPEPQAGERSSPQRSAPQQAARRFIQAALRFLSETETLPEDAFCHLFTPADRARLMRLARLLEHPSPTDAIRITHPVMPQQPREDIPEEYWPGHRAIWGKMPRSGQQ